MSYVVRHGNLRKTPQLRQDERGDYTRAELIVSDSFLDRGGVRKSGPAVFYTVIVRGAAARNLVAAAEAGGNIPVLFAGSVSAREWVGKDGITRETRTVWADEIGVPLFVPVTVNKHAASPAHTGSETPNTSTGPSRQDPANAASQTTYATDNATGSTSDATESLRNYVNEYDIDWPEM